MRQLGRRLVAQLLHVGGLDEHASRLLDWPPKIFGPGHLLECRTVRPENSHPAFCTAVTFEVIVDGLAAHCAAHRRSAGLAKELDDIAIKDVTARGSREFKVEPRDDRTRYPERLQREIAHLVVNQAKALA